MNKSLATSVLFKGGKGAARLLEAVEMATTFTIDGFEYPSRAAACRKFGIQRHDYHNRKKCGWTDRQIFGIDPPPVRIHKGNAIVVDGIEYPSAAAACRKFGVRKSAYDHRIKAGCTIRQALGLDPTDFELRSQTVDEQEAKKSRRGKNAKFDADGKLVTSQVKAGDTFGPWTAMEDHCPVTTRTRVKCRCKCGQVATPAYLTLTRNPKGCVKCCRASTRGNGVAQQKDRVKVGDKFERWEVIGEPYKDERSRKYSAMVRCTCGSGVEKPVQLQGLLSGATKSCGCLNLEVRSNEARLVGKRFGRLVVQSFSRREVKASGKPGDAYYHCVCDCGKTAEVCSKHLHHRKETASRTGGTRSCGCLQSETSSKLGNRMVKEGRLANARFPYEGKMGNILMRSRWEVAVAYELDARGWDFEFEPGPFEVVGLLYSPDFYVPSQDLYIEVKGLVRDNFPEKWAAFSKDRNAILLDKVGVAEFTGKKISAIERELRDIELDPADGRNRWYYVGSKSHTAKLTEERVGWIRAVMANAPSGSRSQKVRRIADACGVGEGTIENVLAGRTWRHVA